MRKIDRGAVRRYGITSVGAGCDDLSLVEPRSDALVVEEPLEIRWAGETIATTMRTPGRDHDLALGFLHSEGIIESAADVSTVAHCGRLGEPGYGNVIDVTPGPGASIDIDARMRRGTLVSSACGVCGRQSIDDLLSRLKPLPSSDALPLDLIFNAVSNLWQEQPLFVQTGGAHGAALFSAQGECLSVAEDIGRHNAVDKLVGVQLRAPRSDLALLVVSGRLSFEMVQKAAVLAVPVVASVSAASSLAVELADALGLCAVGFIRDERANIYTHPKRLRT